MMKIKTMLKWASALIFALITTYGTQANAGLIVNGTGGFVCATESGSLDVDCQGAVDPNISWDVNLQPQSSLDISFNANTLLTDPGAPQVFEMAIQTNQEIPTFGGWNMDFTSTLTFQDHLDPGDIIHTQDFDVNVDFNETENLAPCNDFPINPNNTTCDDRYLLDFDLTDIMFMTDTTIYEVVFGIEGGPGTTVTDLGGGLFEIFTGEFDTTQVNFTADATKTPKELPEPTILFLFGIGLAGIGFSQRRKLQS